MKNPIPFSSSAPRLVTLLAALSLASSVSATTILEDTFEEYEAGFAPTSPWTAPSNITVSSNADAQSAFGPEGDTQGMRIRNLNASFTPTVSASFDLSTESYSTLDIQFDYMYVTQTGNPQFTLQDGSTNAIRIMLTTANGYVSVREGSSFTELTDMSINSGTWYRFYLSIDMSSSTFDLTIEDENGATVTISDLAFENSVTSVDNILYSFNAAASSTSGEYFIDNVDIKIPEPQSVTMALGALSVLAMLACKRHRS